EQPIAGKLSVLRQWLNALAAAPTPADTARPGAERSDEAPAQDGFGVRTIDSVVTIRNPLPYAFPVFVRWTGDKGWKALTLATNSAELLVTAGANRTATIRFDGSSAPGYQEVTVSLYSKNFVAGGPANWQPRSLNDGM